MTLYHIDAKAILGDRDLFCPQISSKIDWRRVRTTGRSAGVDFSEVTNRMSTSPKIAPILPSNAVLRRENPKPTHLCSQTLHKTILLRVTLLLTRGYTYCLPQVKKLQFAVFCVLWPISATILPFIIITLLFTRGNNV